MMHHAAKVYAVALAAVSLALGVIAGLFWLIRVVIRWLMR